MGPISSKFGRFDRLLRRVRAKDKHIAFCLPCELSYVEKQALSFLPEDLKTIISDHHKNMLDESLSTEKFTEMLTSLLGLERSLFEQVLSPNFEDSLSIRDKKTEVLNRVEADQMKCLMDLGIPVSCGELVYDDKPPGVETPCSIYVRHSSAFPEDYGRFLKLFQRVKIPFDHLTCCLNCHFAYEEELAFPYLPDIIRNQLQEEHDLLRDLEYPEDAVFEHSIREMVFFRKYLEPKPQDVYNQKIKKQEILDRIDTDHLDYYLTKGFPLSVNGIDLIDSKNPTITI